MIVMNGSVPATVALVENKHLKCCSTGRSTVGKASSSSGSFVASPASYSFRKNAADGQKHGSVAGDESRTRIYLFIYFACFVTALVVNRGKGRSSAAF